MTQQVSQTSTSASTQQLQQSTQHARDIESTEHHASANASAGLNLNLFGALSGAFSSKSKKTTHRNADGSEESVEDKHDQGMANAAARGQGAAYAQGSAEEYSLKARERGGGQSAAQGKMVEGKVDHLGLGA